MSTALVTPVWLNEPHYEARCKKWAMWHCGENGEVIFPDEPRWDLIVLDNASEYDLPHEYGLPEAHIRFTTEYRRPTHLDYPYAWRAFAFLGQLIDFWEYDKVVFIESDLFVCSHRVIDWANNAEGLSCLWSPKYGMPEPAMIVLTKCAAYDDFVRDHPWKSIKDAMLELTVPWTHVERGLIGDRYEECSPPAGADFAAQLRLEDEPVWSS